MRVLLLSVLSVLHSLITLGGTQRSVTLSQWLAKGVRKSEYRTIANNVLDGNGNVVQQKFGSMKDANGQTVYYCIDATGQRRSDGEEYGRPNGHFKYRCSNGIETIIG
ncbi:unnamed protein product [Litomosoides sigmodontis]|uniref:Uncharacterized protein n=1 Tax=Litomosoides sigmodontis TaxID=42156 RepID=A0A3P6UC16_LITSI|nr:unnamed protein product [Litomosoides sigmodontis]